MNAILKARQQMLAAEAEENIRYTNAHVLISRLRPGSKLPSYTAIACMQADEAMNQLQSAIDQYRDTVERLSLN